MVTIRVYGDDNLGHRSRRIKRLERIFKDIDKAQLYADRLKKSGYKVSIV